MKIIQDFATTSNCYRAGRTITVKGLMLHSVGCNQPDPKVFARIWKNPKAANDVCCHGVLGADGWIIVKKVDKEIEKIKSFFQIGQATKSC